MTAPLGLAGLPAHVRAAAERAQRSAAPRPAPKPQPVPRRGRMNKTEADYARELAAQLHVGAIKWYAFEQVKLQLGRGAWYTPDFCYIDRDGSAVFIEVKGHRREAAIVRIKVAANRYPHWHFFIVRRGKHRGWAEDSLWDHSRVEP